MLSYEGYRWRLKEVDLSVVEHGICGLMRPEYAQYAVAAAN
jgi:hypothetical protein